KEILAFVIGRVPIPVRNEFRIIWIWRSQELRCGLARQTQMPPQKAVSLLIQVICNVCSLGYRVRRERGKTAGRKQEDIANERRQRRENDSEQSPARNARFARRGTYPNCSRGH